MLFLFLSVRTNITGRCFHLPESWTISLWVTGVSQHTAQKSSELLRFWMYESAVNKYKYVFLQRLDTCALNSTSDATSSSLYFPLHDCIIICFCWVFLLIHQTVWIIFLEQRCPFPANDLLINFTAQVHFAARRINLLVLKHTSKRAYGTTSSSVHAVCQLRYD